MDPRNPTNGQTADSLRNPLPGEAARPTGRPSQCEAPSAAQGEARSRVRTIKGQTLRRETDAAETGKLLSTWPARILIVSLALIALGTFAAQALEQLAELDRQIELAGRV